MGITPSLTLKIGKGTVYVVAPKDQSPERIAKVKEDIERACQPIFMEIAQRRVAGEKDKEVIPCSEKSCQK
jgi:hypothetical protein